MFEHSRHLRSASLSFAFTAASPSFALTFNTTFSSAAESKLRKSKAFGNPIVSSEMIVPSSPSNLSYPAFHALYRRSPMASRSLTFSIKGSEDSMFVASDLKLKIFRYFHGVFSNSTRYSTEILFTAS